MAITPVEIGSVRATSTRTLSYSLPPHLDGDVLVLVAICQNVAGVASAGITTPLGWTQVGTEEAFGLPHRRAEAFSRRVVGNEVVPDPTLTRSGTESEGSNTVLFAMAFTLRGAKTPAILFIASTPTTLHASTRSYRYTYPAGTAYTFQCNFQAGYVNPPMTPTGTTVGAWSSSTGSGASMTAEYVTIAGGDMTFTGVSALTSGQVRFIIVFDPLPDPIRLRLIPAGRAVMRLGCAENYDVFITRNDIVTAEPEIVDAVGWSKLEWGRVLDDISTASVTIPDRLGGVRCCAPYGGLVPWRYGLRVERDSQLVWDGPIVSINRDHSDVPSITVAANDQLARFRKRFAVLESQNYLNLDAGEIFSAICAGTALRSPNGWVFRIPEVRVGLSVTREIVARDFELAWDLITELFESALDGYVLAGDLMLYEPLRGWFYHDGADTHTLLDGPYDQSSGELVYGLFTTDAWTEQPGWSMSGWNQANSVYVAGADSGEQGFRRIWTAEDPTQVFLDGPLEMVDQRSLHKTADNAEPITADSVFQARAVSLLQLRAAVPAVIEGASLAQSAPVSVPHLRPGSLWTLDVHDACYGQLLAVSRLKSVTVKATAGSGLTEDVSVVLNPAGYTEADLG